jgi:hypothetical protein
MSVKIDQFALIDNNVFFYGSRFIALTQTFTGFNKILTRAINLMTAFR